MPKYDFACNTCGTVEERVCAISEREKQTCNECSGAMNPLFTPTTNFVVPERFRHSFSELTGYLSEKDFIKDNPNLTRINQSTFKTKRQKDEARWEKANKEAADIERAMKANKTLTGSKKRRSA